MSRTDSIGDVVLTLPMAGLLKKNFPFCKIYFLARTYTEDVVALSQHVDGFINYDFLEKLSVDKQRDHLRGFAADIFIHVFPKKEIARLAIQAGIPTRVGTTNRLYHWLYCNKLVPLSRKNSQLHEAQLNFKLLGFAKLATDVPLRDIENYYGFSKIPVLDEEFMKLVDRNKFNLILHPKSKGSAREWGLNNFEKLAMMLPEHYKIFVSGTAEDGAAMRGFLKNERVIDLGGKLSLRQFIAFIDACDGLVAASTGPLHLAAAMGKKAIGLFVPMRPIHPGRWAPLGKQAGFLVAARTNCMDCRKGGPCSCILDISPESVIRELETRHDAGNKSLG